MLHLEEARLAVLKKGIPPSMPDVVASQLRLYLRPADPKWHDIKEIFHHV